MEKNRLVLNLIDRGYLKTSNIIKAFQNIDRKDFVLERDKDLAYIDSPLSIGYEQTISQPAVVAFMIEKLQPQQGDMILDIGSGSGWTTALLAHIVSQKGNSKLQISNQKQIQNFNNQNSKFKNLNGKVIAIELIPELKEFGVKNIAKYNFVQKNIVQFICYNGKQGYLKSAPYDRILVSASASNISQHWREQLSINGVIVACVGNSIWKITKKTEQEFEEIEYPGFVFVPLK